MYIVHKRFKHRGIYHVGEKSDPPFNLARGTALVCKGNTLYTLDGKPICYITSEDAHQHFANDKDGRGLRRGDLTQAIQAQLQKKNHHQERWDKVWDDRICQKYKRTEHADYWLWNHDFFEAAIFDLEYILQLVKGV